MPEIDPSDSLEHLQLTLDVVTRQVSAIGVAAAKLERSALDVAMRAMLSRMALAAGEFVDRVHAMRPPGV